MIFLCQSDYSDRYCFCCQEAKSYDDISSFFGCFIHLDEFDYPVINTEKHTPLV